MQVDHQSKGLTIWFTGLSAAGKSTLSERLKQFLESKFTQKTVILDGDKIRTGINEGLGFSQQDRAENIRRVSEVAKLLNQEGLISIVACISPYQKDRKRARQTHDKAHLRFIEVYVNCDISVCQKRDPKGLYQKVRIGQIKNFTGISDPYEAPKCPQLVLNTHVHSLQQTEAILFEYISNLLKKQNSIRLQETNYKDYICDYETMNLLQVFLQGWTEVPYFMNYEQVLECIYFKTFTNKNGDKVFQPIPLFLLIDEKIASEIQKSHPKTIRLISPIDNEVIASLQDPIVQDFRNQQFGSKIFGSSSENHPKVSLWKQKKYLLSGSKLTFLKNHISFNDGLDYLRNDVQTLKNSIASFDSDCVFAFQLRNPLHNGHLFLLRKAKQALLQKGFKKPLLLLHPCGGWVKDDDVPLKVRIKQHEQLLNDNSHFSSGEFILAIWPSPMYYAGPLEVLWHIKSRQLLGVNFMVVGRDPAGVKHPDHPSLDLYDPFDGQRVINIAKKAKLLTTEIIPFKVISWNKVKKELMEYDIAKKEEFEMISGSELRKMAKNDMQVPDWLMNKASWTILKQFYQAD